jgi:hypothetical protein
MWIKRLRCGDFCIEYDYQAKIEVFVDSKQVEVIFNGAGDVFSSLYDDWRMGAFGQILEPIPDNSNVKIIIHCPKDKVYTCNKNCTQITEGDSEIINFLSVRNTLINGIKNAYQRLRCEKK